MSNSGQVRNESNAAVRPMLKTSVERREPSQYVRITNYGEPTVEALEMAVRVAIAAGKPVSVDTMGMDLAVHPDSSARDLITIVQLVQDINRLKEENNKAYGLTINAERQVSAEIEKYDRVTADLHKLIKDQEAVIKEQKTSLDAISSKLSNSQEHAKLLEIAAKKDEKRINVLIESQNKDAAKILNLEEDYKRSQSKVSDLEQQIERSNGLENYRLGYLSELLFGENSDESRAAIKVATGYNRPVKEETYFVPANGSIIAILRNYAGRITQTERDNANSRIAALEEANKELDQVLKSGKLAVLDHEQQIFLARLMRNAAVNITQNKGGVPILHMNLVQEEVDKIKDLSGLFND